jgi:histidinol-phosphate aminotransferase
MPAALAEVLMQVKPPYTPNAAAEVTMLTSLDDREALMDRVRVMVGERERMRRALEQLEWLEVYPSEANFVLARLRPGFDAKTVYDGLAQRGIFVRYFDKPRLRDCLRISVGLPEHTDRLVDALREIASEHGR